VRRGAARKWRAIRPRQRNAATSASPRSDSSAHDSVV
jgi:hypothetical protein